MAIHTQELRFSKCSVHVKCEKGQVQCYDGTDSERIRKIRKQVMALK